MTWTGWWASWPSSGRAASTRRNYLRVFKGFYRFLEVRTAAEIEAAFGMRLACPLASIPGRQWGLAVELGWVRDSRCFRW